MYTIFQEYTTDENYKNYISLEFTSNVTISDKNCFIQITISEENYRIDKCDYFYFYQVPKGTAIFVALPVNYGDRVNFNIHIRSDIKDYRFFEKLNIIEYPDIYHKKILDNSFFNYTSIWKERNDYYTMTFYKHALKKPDTHFIVVKLFDPKFDIFHLSIVYSIRKYYYNFYNENTLHIYDIKKENDWIYIKLDAKKPQIVNIDLSISSKCDDDPFYFISFKEMDRKYPDSYRKNECFIK